MSLRSRLLLLFLALGVIPMLVVGAVTNARNLRALEALVAEEVRVIASQVATETESRLEVQRGLLLFLAENVETRRLLTGEETESDGRNYLASTLERLDPDFRAIDITDRVGRSVLFRGDEAVSAATPGGGTAFVPRLAEPVQDGDVVLGEVRAAVRAAGLFPGDFADRHFGDSGLTLVVDRPSGRLVHHPTRSLIGADAGDLLGLGPRADEPWDELDRSTRWDREGSGWVAAAVPISGSDWAVLSAASLGEFEGPFESAASANVALLMLIALAASTVFALVLARTTSPLVQLTDSARAVAGGNLNPPLPRAAVGEVGTLVSAFQAMTRRIQEMLVEVRRSRQLAAVGEFSAEIAHEIRNPLTSVKMNLQGVVRRLTRNEPDAVDLRPLEIALRETERLERVVGGVLTLGRIGAGERTRFTVSDLLSEVQDGLPATAREGRLLDVVPTTQPIEIQADRDALASAIDNLIRNALEAVGPGGSVRVSTEAVSHHVHIHVRDDGPGIPAALRDRVFEPFVTTRDAGNGFGLALATRAVEAHGGDLRLVESEQGAHFVLSLPHGPRAPGPATGPGDGGSLVP